MRSLYAAFLAAWVTLLSIKLTNAKFVARDNIATAAVFKNNDVSLIVQRISRCGATAIKDLDDEDEYDEEEEEEEEEEDSLIASAKKYEDKMKKKKSSAVKKALNTKLKSTPVIKKRSRFRLPYIIRAMFNPFTVIKMTKAYFGSLVNLNYLKNEKEEDSSAGLRSALEEKAKRSSPGSAKKGKRKMRPGQAKTLSDLPQLSA